MTAKSASFRPRLLLLLAVVATMAAGCGKSPRSPANAAPNTPEGLPKYVNERGGLSATLTEHYVDFSFTYPAGWELLRNGPRNPDNFVRVTHKDGKGRTVQQFNVGSLNIRDPNNDWWIHLPLIAQEMHRVYPERFNGYRKVSEGKVKFGGYDAYELRFQSWMPNPNGATIQNAGGGEPDDVLRQTIGDTLLDFRAVMIPQEGMKTGAWVLMYAEQGRLGGNEMDTIINSFKFGKD